MFFVCLFLNAPKELSLPNNEADVTQGIAQRGYIPEVRKHSWLCSSYEFETTEMLGSAGCAAEVSKML